MQKYTFDKMHFGNDLSQLLSGEIGLMFQSLNLKYTFETEGYYETKY